ncbi:MAG TPA: PASTA domain-containing protein [Steroidobacteraceae bacterium]|jgi:beta-lactam-binding protein with PASTA domain|nr:PASTA domain-containing protein [Steroidobacteraceae bacterium]
MVAYRLHRFCALLLILSCCAGHAWAAAVYVQGSSQSGSAVRTAATAAFTSAQTAGNLNLVFIAWQGTASNLVSLTDSAGNAYTRAHTVNYGTTSVQMVYYARSIVGSPAGKNSVTVTFNAKVANPDLRVVEYGGIDPSRPLDAVGGLGSAAALTSSGAVATSSANDVLVASNFSQQSVTGPGTGYTLRLKDQYAQIVEDAAAATVGKYTATAPQTKSGWYVMQLVALRAAAAPPPVLVPNVVGQPQAAASTAVTGAGLTVGAVTRQSSVTVAAGYVVSSSPVAGASVPSASPVNLLISSGPAMVTVPNVVGQAQASAVGAITAQGLAVGAVTPQSSATVAAGSVISESPSAGTSVAPATSVNLVVSNGPAAVLVPNVAGQAQAAASSALAAAGLVVGSITQQSSATVAAGNVVSSSPAAGASVASGSSVSLVVSSGPPAGPPPVSVPNVIGQTQSAASTALTAAGLAVGSITQQTSASVPAGSIVGSTPAAGASVAPGSSVSLVVSSGPPAPPPPPPPVTVPSVIGTTQTAAAGAITGAGLAVGTITQQASTLVAAGSVMSTSPAAGSSVSSGTAVNLVVSSGAPAVTASPYPQSSILSGITWNESTKQRYASGSDIWDSAWASDGQVYGVWGDGNGFTAPAKKQIGVSQLAGSPDSGPLVGTDVYLGSPSPRAGGCGQKPTVGGKPHGVAALPNGVIYMFHSTYDLCTSQAWLARSLDNGVTWTDDVAGAVWPDANGFNPSAILQYGAGQYGALMPDATYVPYVYIYGGKTGAAFTQYLARVPAFPSNAIESAGNWSYYAGTDASGNPVWAASSAQAVPVWSDPNYSESLAVSFDAAIGRYVAYDDHGNACGGSPCERQVSLFDAPNPWGPWSTFDYEEQFDNANCGGNCLGSQEAVGWAMMQKWFSPDGLSLWVEYSSQNAYDSLNLIKGTMSLAAGSTITNLKISTGTPAVLDRLSPSNPGNLEFIDSPGRFTAIPPAYLNDEVVRLARNDAAIGDQAYVSFTSTTAQSVCIGWNSADPPPAWLAGWNATGQSLVGDVTYNVYSMPMPAGPVTLPGPASADGYILFVGCN